MARDVPDHHGCAGEQTLWTFHRMVRSRLYLYLPVSKVYTFIVIRKEQRSLGKAQRKRNFERLCVLFVMLSWSWTQVKNFSCGRIWKSVANNLLGYTYKSLTMDMYLICIMYLICNILVLSAEKLYVLYYLINGHLYQDFIIRNLKYFVFGNR